MDLLVSVFWRLPRKSEQMCYSTKPCGVEFFAGLSKFYEFLLYFLFAVTKLSFLNSLWCVGRNLGYLESEARVCFLRD